MTFDEFKPIAMILKTVYQRDNFLNSPEDLVSGFRRLVGREFDSGRPKIHRDKTVSTYSGGLKANCNRDNNGHSERLGSWMGTSKKRNS